MSNNKNRILFSHEQNTKVGIGTDAPGALLHLVTDQGSSTLPAIHMDSPDPTIVFNDTTNTGSMNIKWQAGTGNSQGLRFWRDNNGDGNPVFMIDLNGNVGVKRVPSSGGHIALDIAGDARITSYMNTLGDLSQGLTFSPDIGDSSTPVASKRDDYTPGVIFGYGAGKSALVGLVDADDHDGMGLAFLTHPSGTGADDSVEAMRIERDGDVVIGTNRAGAQLHVNDSINGINSGLLVSNYNTTAGTGQHTRLQFGLARNSGTLKSNAGEIIVGKSTDWTDDDNHLNSFMKFKIMDKMVSTDQLFLHTGGADFRGYVGTDEIRTKSASMGGAVNGMKINIGESYAHESVTLGAEILFVNAETGIQLNTSPDNWASGWAGRDTTFISGTEITINGDHVWHDGNIDGDDGLVRAHKRSITLTKATEKRVLRITGTGYSSAIKIHMWGTTDNVVVNTLAEILANHSLGINISSNTGAYTGVTWRVVSDNDKFDLYVTYGNTGTSQGGSLPARFAVYTYGDETVTFEPTATAYVVNSNGTNEHTHVTGTNTINHTSRTDTIFRVGGYGYFEGSPISNVQGNDGIYLGTSASNSDRHVSIVSPSTGNSYIDFATTEADFAGRIIYDHPDEQFQIFVNGGTENLRLNNTDTIALKRLSSRASYGWNSYGNIGRVEYDVDTISIVHSGSSNSYTFHEFGNAETFHHFRITVEFKTGNDTHWGVGFAGTGTDPENNMWSVIMRDNNNVRVQKRSSGTQTYYPSTAYEVATGIDNNDGIWHTLTVEKVGDLLSVWVDGSRRIAYRDFPGANDIGTIGLTTFKASSTVMFRGFRVERLSTTTETLTGPLHIYKTSSGNGESSIRIDGAANTERSITFNDDGVHKWWFGRDNTGNVASGLGFWNSTTSKFALTFDDTTSNIAIGGISTSDAKILIGGIGANNDVKMLGFGENTTGTSSIWFNSGFEPTNQENYLSLASSYGDKLMMWKLDGRVGINGANPTRTLEVNGSIRAYGENVNGGDTEMILDGQFGNKLFFNRSFTVPHTGTSNTFTKFFNFCIQSSGAYYYKVTVLSKRHNDAGSGTGNRFYGCIVDEGYLAWETDGDYGTNHHDGQTSSLGGLTVLSKSCFLADSTTATSGTADNNNYGNCIVRYEIQFNGVIDTTNTGQAVYVNVELTGVHGNNMITSPHFLST